jgi:hypothetical protein
MATLFDQTLAIARKLAAMREGVATGGSTTTLENTNAEYTNGQYRSGTLWILSGGNSGKSRTVTDHAANKFTFVSLGATAIVAGVRYAVADKDYPLDVLIQGVNEALRELNPRAVEDTSLVTVAFQSAYTLPAGVERVKRVEVEHYPGSGTYSPFYYWAEENGQLRFTDGFAPERDGYAIRLVCEGGHTDLVDDADPIPASVNLEVLYWRAMIHVCTWGLRQYGGDKKRRLTDLLNEAEMEYQRRKTNQKKLKRQPKLAEWQ